LLLVSYLHASLSFLRIFMLSVFFFIFFEFKRWRAVRVFRGTLVSGGMPLGEARSLSRSYPGSFGEIIALLRN